MHANPLPQSAGLVLTAQAVFLLECGHTHSHTHKVTDITITLSDASASLAWNMKTVQSNFGTGRLADAQRYTEKFRHQRAANQNAKWFLGSI